MIGPSGVGKSSFLRAGVIPAAPEGWGILICQPGEAPFAALARALVPEFEGDREAIARLVHLTEPEDTVAMVTRWRHDTIRHCSSSTSSRSSSRSTPPDVQARFASLIGSSPARPTCTCVLAMRDDFLYRCHAHEPLRPILEDLTRSNNRTARRCAGH